MQRRSSGSGEMMQIEGVPGKSRVCHSPFVSLHLYSLTLMTQVLFSSSDFSLFLHEGEHRQGRILLQLSEIPQLNCFCCSLYCKSNES